MQIVDFQSEFIGDAARIALENYEEQRRAVPLLPEIKEIPFTFSPGELGVAAFEGTRLVGYLISTPPFENAFRSTSAVGVFSEVHKNGAIPENRAELYARMYAAAGELWADAGASSHAICLYAAHADARERLFQCGFGMRCIDAIRGLDEIAAPVGDEFTFVTLAPEDCDQVYPLELALDAHMTRSPTFMLRPSESLESFRESAARPETKLFAALSGGKPVGFLKVERTGETFACSAPDYLHIDGAYALPGFRGRGAIQALINCAIRALKGEGYERLGVDFESINPIAHRTWLRYFEPYTYGLVRRIDENALKKGRARRK